ncbi:hypothetical protein Ciccas_007109 [Cichlidogyrus casuarinus]|uniref:Ig-like domain-containing protein n=1 Tax=Cichlidogyrus casuarinus TaxID=1844966 RepID=A0ABD2Q3S9_9PLAT
MGQFFRICAAFIILSMATTLGLVMTGLDSSLLLANVGTEAHLPCRVQPSFLKMGQVESPLVQWSIDGFGFDQVSIQEAFRGRYVMTHNLNEGIFDLRIINVTLDDDAEFFCQLNVQKDESVERQDPAFSLIKSRAVHLNVLLAPSEIALDYLISITKEKKERPVWIASRGNQEAVSVKMGEIAQFLCHTREAKPAAKLTWFLDEHPISLEPIVGNLRSEKVERRRILQNGLLTGDVEYTVVGSSREANSTNNL